MLFRQISDPGLAQYAYLIGCQQAGEALVIDPERDVDRYLEAAESEGLRLVAAAETHVHADFLSGCRELADRGRTVYLSDEGGEDWRYRWPDETEGDVVLLADGDVFRVGRVELTVLHTPGHTPEHVSLLVTDRGGGADRPMGIVSGDFLFVGSLGRPDLLETAAGQAGAMRPAAEQLHASLDRLLELDDWLQVWPGHGAGSACGKGLGSVPDSTLGYERRFNPAIDAARRGLEPFVESILADQPDPPVYFARMKRLNRDGPPPLGELPRPRRLEPDELAAGSADRSDREVADGAGDGVQLLDARRDRAAFMAAHLRGSLYASPAEDFAVVAGSYLDPERPVVLIVAEEDREEAVRALVRVGVDRVEGWAPPDALEALAGGDALVSLPTAHTLELDELQEEGALVVDVRRTDEYRSGHVPGAELAPHVRLPERLDDLPADRTLAVHCRSGNRSSAAAAYLAAEGREVVYVDGLLSDWMEARPDRVERGDGAGASAVPSTGGDPQGEPGRGGSAPSGVGRAGWPPDRGR